MSVQEASRTFNAARNASWATGLHMLTIICQFVSRSVFVQLMGIDYLGINDLFSNILMLLSFTDLGIGSAIVFSMYKPLAKNDIETLTALMSFYKKAYRIIALVIAVLGLALLPFLDIIMNEPPQIQENITVIYLLYLLHAVLTYCYSYKKSIITADQKEYIVTIYYRAFYFLQVSLQIIFLLLTHQFILYLLMQIVCSFLNNVFVSRKAERMYPFIKDTSGKKLKKEELHIIIDNVRSLVIYKLSDILMNSIDNILISSLVSVRSVALCSNYLLIENSANQLIKQFISGFTASIGNLNAVSGQKKQIEIFDAMLLITTWLYGYLTIGLILLTTPLVQLWLGEMYTIGTTIVYAMALRNYIAGIQFVPYTYRTTMNLLGVKRFMPLAGAAVNLVLSIILAQHLGVAGIFLATIIARLLTTTWADIYIVFQKGFQCSPVRIYGKVAFYTIVMLVNLKVTEFFISHIVMEGIFGFIIRVVVCSIVCNLIFFLCYFRSKPFQFVWNKLVNLVSNQIKKG